MVILGLSSNTSPLTASQRVRHWEPWLGPQGPEEGGQPGTSGSSGRVVGVSTSAEVLVAELAHTGLAGDARSSWECEGCPAVCSGQLGASEECWLSEWVDGVTMPFLSVQGKRGQQASSPQVVQIRPSLYPTPWVTPSCPFPIPSGVSPWASPFHSINRFCSLKSPHLFGEPLREGTVGPISTLGFWVN